MTTRKAGQPKKRSSKIIMPVYALDGNDEEEWYIAGRLKERAYSRRYAETVRLALKTEYAIYMGDVIRLSELHPGLLRNIVDFIASVTQGTTEDIQP